MCILKKLLCALALVTTAQPAGEARDNDALLARIAAEISRREPEVKLSRQTRVLFGKGIVESNKAEPEGVFQTWEGAGGGSVTLVLFILDTREGAAEHYQTSKLPRVGPGISRVPLDTKVEGVGEEAHAWRGKHTPGHGVTFRKGRFTADVEASSLETAKRFASYIAGALPNR